MADFLQFVFGLMSWTWRGLTLISLAITIVMLIFARGTESWLFTLVMAAFSFVLAAIGAVMLWASWMAHNAAKEDAQE